MFGIGVGNAPVWCQPYRGIFLVYYIDKFMLTEAPWGDEILLTTNEKRHTTSPNSVTLSVYRVERINRWHHSSTGEYSEEAPWGDEIFGIYSTKIPRSSKASTNVYSSICPSTSNVLLAICNDAP